MECELLVAGVGSGTGLFTCDCLRIEGALWLVPAWLTHRTEEWRKPARMIRVPPTWAQEIRFGGLDLLITRPIPTDVLAGHCVSHAGVAYEVREAPDEPRLPTRRSGH